MSREYEYQARIEDSQSAYGIENITEVDFPEVDALLASDPKNLLQRTDEEKFNGNIACCRIGGRIAGIAGLDIYGNVQDDPNETIGEVRSVCVASWAKGKGIGKALVRSRTEMAESLGIPEVMATTNRHNVPFFNSCDFREQMDGQYILWMYLSQGKVPVTNLHPMSAYIRQAGIKDQEAVMRLLSYYSDLHPISPDKLESRIGSYYVCDLGEEQGGVVGCIAATVYNHMYNLVPPRMAEKQHEAVRPDLYGSGYGINLALNEAVRSKFISQNVKQAFTTASSWRVPDLMESGQYYISDVGKQVLWWKPNTTP